MSTVKILYPGNYAAAKYLPMRPVKTFKRAGLTQDNIKPVLLGTLETSRRACMVTCIDGVVTSLDNWTMDRTGRLEVETTECTSE